MKPYTRKTLRDKISKAANYLLENDFDGNISTSQAIKIAIRSFNKHIEQYPSTVVAEDLLTVFEEVNGNGY